MKIQHFYIRWNYEKKMTPGSKYHMEIEPGVKIWYENWPRGQFTMGFKIPYDTGLWFGQTEHNHDHLWYRYSTSTLNRGVVCSVLTKQINRMEICKILPLSINIEYRPSLGSWTQLRFKGNKLCWKPSVNSGSPEKDGGSSSINGTRHVTSYNSDARYFNQDYCSPIF